MSWYNWLPNFYYSSEYYSSESKVSNNESDERLKESIYAFCPIQIIRKNHLTESIKDNNMLINTDTDEDTDEDMDEDTDEDSDEDMYLCIDCFIPIHLCRCEKL